MCNPKDNLVRMIRTMFGIGTIRKCVVSVLEVEVKLNLLTVVLPTVNNAANCEQCCAAPHAFCCAANRHEQRCAGNCEQCCQQGCLAMKIMLLQHCSTLQLSILFHS